MEEERKKEVKRREWRTRSRTSKHEGAESFNCVRVVLCNISKDRTIIYKGDDDDASVKR